MLFAQAVFLFWYSCCCLLFHKNTTDHWPTYSQKQVKRRLWRLTRLHRKIYTRKIKTWGSKSAQVCKFKGKNVLERERVVDLFILREAKTQKKRRVIFQFWAHRTLKEAFQMCKRFFIIQTDPVWAPLDSVNYHIESREWTCCVRFTYQHVFIVIRVLKCLCALTLEQRTHHLQKTTTKCDAKKKKREYKKVRLFMSSLLLSAITFSCWFSRAAKCRVSRASFIFLHDSRSLKSPSLGDTISFSMAAFHVFSTFTRGGDRDRQTNHYKACQNIKITSGCSTQLSCETFGAFKKYRLIKITWKEIEVFNVYNDEEKLSNFL